MIIVLAIPSVINIWYLIGTLVIPSLLIPTLSVLFKKPISSNAIVLLMLGSVFITGMWFLAGKILGHYPLNIEPFYPGLLFSLTVYVTGRSTIRKLN